MGTVLVTFLFFWKDNALAPQICKTFNINQKKMKIM